MSRENLSPREREHLGRALVSAFDRDHLERMVSYSLDQDLNAITEPGALTDVAFELVQWSIRQGRLAILVEAAFEQNPGNPELRRFRLEVWEGDDSESATLEAGRNVGPGPEPGAGLPDAPERVTQSGESRSNGSARPPSRRQLLWVAGGVLGAGGLLALGRSIYEGEPSAGGIVGELQTPSPTPHTSPSSPMPVSPLSPSSARRTTFRQDLIPVGYHNRLGLPIEPTYITVHETGNTNLGTNAEVHRRWYHEGSPGQNDLWLPGAHWIVDDREAIQLIPHNEIALHAGEEANSTSIAVTACVASDLDKQYVRRNLIHLLAKLILEKDLGDFDLSRVVLHNDWMPENPCPRFIRAENAWDSIRENVGLFV